MTNHDPRKLMIDMRDALVSAARVVNDNFGRPVEELGTEYKAQDGDTARTVIDRYAQERMERPLRKEYPNAVYNLEETDVADSQKSLEGKLLFFGDPFDGTANAQPRLPLSTQGLMAAQGGEFVAVVALHPFEMYVLSSARDNGVSRAELAIDSDGEYHIVEGSERKLPPLEETFEKLKSGEHILMPFVDAHYTPVNFCGARKAAWTQRFVGTFDSRCGGRFKNAAMKREMGSNIDAGKKVAEGRLHVLLTDTIGGIYDVAFGAVALPELGGRLTDMYGYPLKVPKTPAEMKTPPQQVVIGSIHPDLHEPLIGMTQACYGEGAEIYIPSSTGKGKIIRVPEYTGFKEWHPEAKKIFDSLGFGRA